MTIPTAWPRTYLLSIYAKAVAEGAIWITGLSEASALSLKNSLYRLRRRSDKSNVTFIQPEYHLVTCGSYDAANARMAVVYNKLPDNQQLPGLESMPEGERIVLTPPVDPLADSALQQVHFEPAQLEMKPEDIDDFIARMTRDATAGGGE